LLSRRTYYQTKASMTIVLPRIVSKIIACVDTTIHLEMHGLGKLPRPTGKLPVLPRVSPPRGKSLCAFLESGRFASQMGENFAGEMQ